MDLDDDALITRAAAGDRRALSALVARHGERVRAIALRFTGNRADAEDIAQTVFISLWRSAPRWRPGTARLSTWIYRVTVNCCIDAARRRRIRAWIGFGGEEDVAADEVAPDEAAEHRSELAAVRRDILALPPRQRAAILLAAEGERGVVEIAAALGVSEGAAEQLLVRARRTLRERMRQRTEGDAVGAVPAGGRTKPGNARRGDGADRAEERS